MSDVASDCLLVPHPSVFSLFLCIRPSDRFVPIHPERYFGNSIGSPELGGRSSGRWNVFPVHSFPGYSLVTFFLPEGA